MTNIENEGNTSDYEGHTDKLYSREVAFFYNIYKHYKFADM